jgi:hypothetical protein
LTEEERKAAWEEFENEKKGINSLVGNAAAGTIANFNFDPIAIAVSSIRLVRVIGKGI